MSGEDHADKPGRRGELLFTHERFNEIGADRRGLRMAVQAIGDGAVNLVLNGCEAARRGNGRREPDGTGRHVV